MTTFKFAAQSSLIVMLSCLGLAACVSTPKVMQADLSDSGRYDKVWKAAIREAAKLQYALTTENRDAGELAFDQRASPPYRQNYWIRVSFGEVKAGADTEIRITCDQQTTTKDMGEDLFNSLLNPQSRSDCKQMREAIDHVLTE